MIGFNSYRYSLYGVAFMSITEADRLAHEQRGEFLAVPRLPSRKFSLRKCATFRTGTHGHAGRVYRR